MEKITFINDNARKFGIEIEIPNIIKKKDLGDLVRDYEFQKGGTTSVVVTEGSEGWSKSVNNNYWHVKFDRSCGVNGTGIRPDTGWEIASYVGHELRDIDHMAGLADFLGKSGLSTSKFCGYHIHADVSDFSTKDLTVLLLRWFKIEAALFAICEEHREQTSYCRPYSDKFKYVVREYCNIENKYDSWILLCPTNLGTHGNPDRKVSLNIVEYAKSINGIGEKNTIELRIPECTLCGVHVKNWAKIFLNFVNFTKNNLELPTDIRPSSSLGELLYYLGLSGTTKEFLVLDEEIHNIKIWFLDKLSKSKSRLSKEANEHKKFIETLS